MACSEPKAAHKERLVMTSGNTSRETIINTDEGGDFSSPHQLPQTITVGVPISDAVVSKGFITTTFGGILNEEVTFVVGLVWGHLGEYYREYIKQ